VDPRFSNQIKNLKKIGRVGRGFPLHLRLKSEWADPFAKTKGQSSLSAYSIIILIF